MRRSENSRIISSKYMNHTPLRRILIICIILVLTTGICSLSQNFKIERYYDKDIIIEAYKIVSLYYPEAKIFVSDSIYDLDWASFDNQSTRKLNGEKPPISFKNKKSKRPQFSQQLKSVLETSDINHVNYKEADYFLHISPIVNGWLRCDAIKRCGNNDLTPEVDRYLIWLDENKIFIFIKQEARQ